MNALITGGAGFIGGHLAEYLVENGHGVTCVDNLTLGTEENIRPLYDKKTFTFFKADVANKESLSSIMAGRNIEIVYHLAANSDIQKGGIDPLIDFHNTFLTTQSVLESMRNHRIKKLFFASTSAVYGEKTNVLLQEETGGLSPISYYGGSKLASEAFISSYAYMNDMDTVIFRFPNVIGPRLTHGVLFDFKKKLLQNPTYLQILGDGTQCKPYMHVSDLINGIMMMTEPMRKGIYNIGVETATTVREIADMMCQCMGLSNVRYDFTGGNRGWKGDVPSFQYDLSKIHTAGWMPKYTSNEAVKATIKSIVN